MKALRNYGLFFMLTLSLLGVLFYRYGRPDLLAGYLVAVNAALFLLYGVDKAAARRERRRAPELLLHLGALAGGSPGAFLGQRLFRHKVAKRSFMVRFWGIALLQTAAAALWFGGVRPPAAG